MCAQNGRADRRQPIGLPTILTGNGLDQPLPLEPAQCLIQRSRRDPQPGKRLDVFRQRIPVLSPIGQARQDQRCRPRITTQRRQRLSIPVPSLITGPAAHGSNYIGSRSIVNRATPDRCRTAIEIGGDRLRLSPRARRGCRHPTSSPSEPSGYHVDVEHQIGVEITHGDEFALHRRMDTPRLRRSVTRSCAGHRLRAAAPSATTRVARLPARPRLRRRCSSRLARLHGSPVSQAGRLWFPADCSSLRES